MDMEEIFHLNEILRLLQDSLNIDFIRAVISGPRNKDGIVKVKIRPVERK